MGFWKQCCIMTCKKLVYKYLVLEHYTKFYYCLLIKASNGDVPLQHLQEITHTDDQSYGGLSDPKVEIVPDGTTLDIDVFDIPWTDMVLKEKIGEGELFFSNLGG